MAMHIGDLKNDTEGERLAMMAASGDDQRERRAIMAALVAWVNQRPGLDPRNYGGGYRDEARSITRDLRDARRLLRAVEWRTDSIPVEVLRDAFRAFSGRLSWHYCAHGQTAATTCGKCHKTWCGDCDPAPAAACHWCAGRGYSTAKPGAGRLEYTTGQYWPTEYRKAACAVLASALWAGAAASMPAESGYQVQSWTQYDADGRTRGRVTSKPFATREAAEASLAELGGHSYGHVQALHEGLCPGDWLRRYFRREFGASIAKRWFS